MNSLRREGLAIAGYALGRCECLRADRSAARVRFVAIAAATAVLVFLLAVIAGGLT